MEAARRHLFERRIDGAFRTFCGVTLTEPPTFDMKQKTFTCEMCLAAVNGPTTRKGASR